MSENLDLYTGEVRVARGNYVLVTKAIASCVAVAFFDRELKLGGMAHIMLPGIAPSSYAYSKTRYAHNGIEELMQKMTDEGSNRGNIRACIVGGGNILERENDSIGSDNAESVKKILKSNGIPVMEEDTGGISRRGLKLEVWSGKVYHNIRDEQYKLLYNFIT